jgi:hypothetical protein
VRLAAEHALNQIYPAWAQSEPAQRAIPQLQTLLQQRPAWVRSAILQVLGKLRAAQTAQCASSF